METYTETHESKRSTCFMCFVKIPLTLRFRRFVTNHEVCDHCYSGVCGYVNSIREKNKGEHYAKMGK